MIRLAFTPDVIEQLEHHLAASAPCEEGAFCVVHTGIGHRGQRLLVTSAILPTEDAWERQAENQLRPSAQYVSAAISAAIAAKAGLLFIHSHPNPYFPPGLSAVDVDAMHALGSCIAPMLDGPFAAVVVHPRCWSGVLWRDSELVAIDRIASCGRTLGQLSQVEELESSPLDARQELALGPMHGHLRSLTVGVVGCGGLGSPIAEQLVRMGVYEVILIDHDALDTPSNVRRVTGATTFDLNATRPPAKVDVVGRHLEQLGLGTKIRRVDGDIRTEAVFRELLDADIVISGTDTHGSRAVVNDLASTYLLPVIDVGVRAGTKRNGLLASLVADVRILTPETPCLWCLGAISADVVREENLPLEERQRLADEGYTVGQAGEPEPSIVALTMLGSGLATCALLALLSDEGAAVPSSYWVDGFFGDARHGDCSEPAKGCRCRQHLGMGDKALPPFFDR